MICASHYMLLQIMFTATPGEKQSFSGGAHIKVPALPTNIKISAQPISTSQLSALNSGLYFLTSNIMVHFFFYCSKSVSYIILNGI